MGVTHTYVTKHLETNLAITSHSTLAAALDLKSNNAFLSLLHCILQELPEDFRWCGSWRETYLCHKAPGYKPGSHKPLQVEGFYSDFLHQPWYCANIELQQAWLDVDNVDRWVPLSYETCHATLDMSLCIAPGVFVLHVCRCWHTAGMVENRHHR